MQRRIQFEAFTLEQEELKYKQKKQGLDIANLICEIKQTQKRQEANLSITSKI